MPVTFIYNGSNQLQADCTGLTSFGSYQLYSNDPASDPSAPSANGTADAAGNLTLVATDIGSLSTGQQIDAWLWNGGSPANDYTAITIYKYGTAAVDQGDIGVTFSYDGATTISVMFPTILGVNYGFFTSCTSTGQFFVGDGTIQTQTITDVTPGSDPSFIASVVDEDTSAFPASLIFVSGAAGPGTADRSGPERPEPTSVVSGVYVAFGSPTLSTDPDYQPIEGVQAWSTDRGRQYELDKTQAGTATVTVIDQTGIYDLTNPDGPYYGMIGPLAPAQIISINPVSSVREPVFTGFVESWDYVLDITERWYILTINLSDAFELLARAETVPDSSGTTVLADDLVDDRIDGVLTDYGWPADKRLIFSGNVRLQQTVYNPQTSLLSVLQDCADAELPNAANLFMDKWGQVAFRGRFSRFLPQNYAPRIGGMTPPLAGENNAIDFWEVGDRNAAETFGIALIAEVEWTLDLKNVINAVVCTPNGIAQADIAGQLVDDPVSISQFGTRVLSISDLLTSLSVANGDGPGQPSRDANDECKIFGQYYVDNYSTPVEMISHIEFHSRDPADPLGAPLWAFICGVEIGDVVTIWTTNPGGGGFKATQLFVEGIHNVVKPLEGGTLDWTMTLDLTPRAWYSIFSGVVYYTPAQPTVLTADFITVAE